MGPARSDTHACPAPRSGGRPRPSRIRLAGAVRCDGGPPGSAPALRRGVAAAPGPSCRGGRVCRLSLGLSVCGPRCPAGEGPVGTMHQAPAARPGAAPRVPNSPPSSGGSAGGSMSPASVLAPAASGRPGVCVPLVFFHPTFFLDAPAVAKQNQRVQLLAVDHSARASMKNAASCEK